MPCAATMVTCYHVSVVDMGSNIYTTIYILNFRILSNLKNLPNLYLLSNLQILSNCEILSNLGIPSIH